MGAKKKRFEYLGFILPLLLALICVVSVTFGTHQASLPKPMPQEFIGRYSYDGEHWEELTEDAELSALKGDLLLQGRFLRAMEAGWQLNFYRNHIGVSVRVNGLLIYEDALAAGTGTDAAAQASLCAREWKGISVPAIGAEDIVEIRLHNPHAAGNGTAYRDFLATLCSDPVGWNLLQQNLERCGGPFRAAGSLLVIISMMLLGAAISAAAVRVPVGGMLLKLGLMTLFAGGYIAFDTLDISYWSEWNALNTCVGQLCMMMAVFCLCHFMNDVLTGRRKTAAGAVTLVSALLNSVLIVLSFTGVTAIFDTLPYWLAAQAVICPILMACCVLETVCGTGKRLMPVSALVLFAAILLDLAGVGATMVWRSPCSKAAFIVLLAVHSGAAVKGIVKNYRAAIRASELEKELEDSKIAIMLSQVKPHFLYNVLNTIYHLYRKEPETAQEALSSFAEYLRCNMLSIEKSEPIPFSEEYQHIQTYLSLEQIRFRGKLDVVYDVEVTDFKLPPLTVEPLVENAVKHGVTKKRGGGIVTISTRRTETGFSISVADTGVGFDPERYMEDGKPHVGIRNVRDRLRNMAGGSLTITSTENGTVAVVTIPAKEAGR